MRRALLRNICRINEEKAKSFLQRCCSPLEDLKVYKYIACDSQAVGREFESRCPLQIIQAFQRLRWEAFSPYEDIVEIAKNCSRKSQGIVEMILKRL